MIIPFAQSQQSMAPLGFAAKSGRRPQWQQAWIDYILSEVEFAFVLARIAMDRFQRGDDKRSRRAACEARARLRLVRQLVENIADPHVRKKIHDIEAEFDRALIALCCHEEGIEEGGAHVI